jgi:hypothetical protein
MKQLILIVLFVFIAVILYLISLPPKEITLNDIHPAVIPRTSPAEPVIQETALPDSVKEVVKHSIPNEPEIQNNSPIENIKTDSNAARREEYYIIVGGFSTLLKAQQQATKLKSDFAANIIVLPPTAEGYYRISYGRYSTLEEAKSSIQSIKTKVKSDAWIYSLNK